ncbi:MmcQ/YjbR family DNA-binding protein [Kribbella antibiotica]|uniref:MmcQ/YjbR family DNA-binding protein n=1 Tax=Kribbella antibiotica TaxID=190195 RepID=A0A4R4YJ61_9ACTN|nr:MmcQ/YjbR family DNA-binding protein [Kribbella antibiotica]TDD44968.1 MmcQ/YjbR family DNA-binding protein [Kribbella antibiotica]
MAESTRTAGERLQFAARGAAGALPGVSEGRPFVDSLDVFKVSGKVFLIVTDDPDNPIVTVKCEPEYGAELQRGYASITPGRYLSKRHWISIGPGERVTERMVVDAVEHSYDLVAGGLPSRKDN